MNYWQYTPYVLPLIGAGILSLSLALSAWWRPPNTGRYAFIALMLSISWWALGYSVELGVSTLSAKIFWTNLQYLGISLVPVSWLVFALQYAGREEWLNRRTISYLLIWPLITQLLAWTNPSHHLFRARAWVQSAGPFPVLEVDFAIGFWLHALYSYLLILLGVYLLVRAQLHARRLYRRQVIALLAASILPWVGNALFIFDLWEEMPAYDLTPFFFSITGLAISWGMLRFQLLEIVPIARETVLENLRDGVLVLDVQNRIADANPAALEMLGRPEQAVVGQSAQHVFSQWPEVKARYRNVVEIQEEITLPSATTPRVYDLRITPLLDSAQKTTGRVVVMRDITVRKAAEEEREILISELNAFAHTVAHELKNPLTMIKAGADLLAGERALQQDAATQNLVRTISHGGAKMGSIIDELLLLASLRQRKDLPLTPLDMAPIVEEALQRLSYLSQKQQAEIIMLGGRLASSARVRAADRGGLGQLSEQRAQIWWLSAAH